jgi:signal transduction histidine kinase
VLTIYSNDLKHGVEVVRVYAPDVGPVMCRPDSVQQIWTNLLHNALHAMGRSGTLEVSLTSHNEGVEVAITDSGHGIPSSMTDTIFEPFVTSKPLGEGTGLGLDIVKKIVSAHAGTIYVESKPGRTTFRVWLPYGDADGSVS